MYIHIYIYIFIGHEKKVNLDLQCARRARIELWCFLFGHTWMGLFLRSSKIKQFIL